MDALLSQDGGQVERPYFFLGNAGAREQTGMANEVSRAAASATARIVWDTADKFLRNVVEPQEYGDYILPFTVLRRLECLLEDSKEDVIEYVETLRGMPTYLIDIAVKERFGLSFYNVSKFNLAWIASVDDNVDKALLSYVNGFSHNIADIWAAFDFPKLVTKLASANRLFEVVKHFSTLSLGSTSVEDSTMGDIFEDVMYRAFDKKRGRLQVLFIHHVTRSS